MPKTSPRPSTTRHRGPAIDFIRTSFYTLPGIARWPISLHGYSAEVFEEICEEAMAQEAANKATSPAAFLAWPREHQPFGEPLTSDLHGGPWQAAACRRQAAARPRESSSAICVALPQRDIPSLLAMALPCDCQSSARLRPSTGPVVLSNALPRACRTTSPRQSTTRHQGPAVDFIRTTFYTFPGVARWPTFLHGCRSAVFDEILKENPVTLAESEA